MAQTSLMKVPSGVRQLQDRFLTMRNKIASMKEKASEAIEGVVMLLEVQGAAFIMGALQGAFYEPNPAKPNDKPGIHLLGIPVEALVGVGFIAGGFLGLGGPKWSEHMGHIGNGALAAWTSNLGRGWGFKFRAEKKGGATKGEVEGEDQSLRESVAALIEGDD